MKKLFCNADGDGELSHEELRALLHALGLRLTEHEVADALHEMAPHGAAATRFVYKALRNTNTFCI